MIFSGHGAAALEAGCTGFASFDERQRKIATLADDYQPFLVGLDKLDNEAEHALCRLSGCGSLLRGRIFWHIWMIIEGLNF